MRWLRRRFHEWSRSGYQPFVRHQAHAWLAGQLRGDINGTLRHRGCFSRQLLELPLKSPDPALVSLLEQHADRLLEQLPRQDEIVGQTRKAISRSLRDGEPSVERVGAELHLSPRTLQRRLQEADTSFRSELNLVRHELALSYLRDARLQIVDIAMLLGYSEHSAFTRAFKQWCGRSPQEARQTLSRN